MSHLLARVLVLLLGVLLLLFATTEVIPAAAWYWVDRKQKSIALILGTFAAMLLVITIAAVMYAFGKTIP